MLSGLFGGKKNALDVAQAALEAMNWKYTRADDRTLITGSKSGSAAALIVLRNEPAKRTLLVMANGISGGAHPLAALESSGLPILHVHTRSGHSAERVAKVCEHLLRKNYEFAIGAFERDPSDGEIRFRIGLPYRDSQPTEEQIQWCIALASDAMLALLRELGDSAAPTSGLEL